jgi:hypothetical protein
LDVHAQAADGVFQINFEIVTKIFTALRAAAATAPPAATSE